MPRLINRELKQEWLNHPVSEALYLAIHERIQEALERIGFAGLAGDPNFDLFTKGMIQAYQEILDLEIEVTDTDEVPTGDTSGTANTQATY